jgi:hypothetical protein
VTEFKMNEFEKGVVDTDPNPPPPPEHGDATFLFIQKRCSKKLKTAGMQK